MLTVSYGEDLYQMDRRGLMLQDFIDRYDVRVKMQVTEVRPHID